MGEACRVFDVGFAREWDGVLMRTATMRPRGSAAALLQYECDPWPDEGGLPLPIASAMAAGLTGCGLVAGCWPALCPAPDDAVRHDPPRHRFRARGVDHAFAAVACPVVVTQSVAGVTALLEQGWSTQQQTLLLLDGDEGAERAAQVLGRLQDWTRFVFPPPAWVLVAPGVDGDVTLFAAASEARLRPVLSAVRRAFEEIGLWLTDRARGTNT